MRQNGFSEDEIRQVYGYVPPDLTRPEFLEAFSEDLMDPPGDPWTDWD